MRGGITREAVEHQIDVLKDEGCAVVFEESLNGKDRFRFQAALASLNQGDELVIIDLPCLGLSHSEVVSCLHDLQLRGINVRTTDRSINTKDFGQIAPSLIGFLAGLAQLERSLVKERTLESIRQRRDNGGNLGGRPRISSVKEGLVLRLRNEGCSYRSIRDQTGLALSTIRRIIVEAEELLV